MCNADHRLEVHHVDYISGLFAWEYPNDMLLTLCHQCHSKEQNRNNPETMLLNTLKMNGFLVSDLVNFCCKMDTDHSFTQRLLKYLRNAQ